MRPASPCSPGNCRPPCDQPTLQTRQPPPAMRPASPCSPGNRRLPCGPAHLAAPAIAACHADQPTLQTRQPPPARHAALPPYRPNRCRTTQAVPRKTDGCSTFTALPPPPSTAKRNRGDSRKGPQLAGGLRREGVAEGRGCRGKGSRRGAIGRPAAVSGMGLRRVWRSFFAGFVPFASLNIRFERVQTASQPYFYSRKRFTPRPHTHQIQPVAAPRQRSAPAGGSRDRHPLRLEDSLPFRPSVRHPETHGSGCRFVGS